MAYTDCREMRILCCHWTPTFFCTATVPLSQSLSSLYNCSLWSKYFQESFKFSLWNFSFFFHFDIFVIIFSSWRGFNMLGIWLMEIWCFVSIPSPNTDTRRALWWPFRRDPDLPLGLVICTGIVTDLIAWSFTDCSSPFSSCSTFFFKNFCDC